MNKTTLGGIVAALGISVTAAIALPLVNVFTWLDPSELMMIRGGVTALLIGVLMPKKISLVTREAILFSVLFGTANLLLYMSIRTWGANPTIVILTMTPLVNIAAKRWRGQKVDLRVYAALIGLLVGVSIALNPWETEFSVLGCFQSISATLVIGVGFEVLSKTKNLDPYNRSFWLALIVLAIGLVAALAQGIVPFENETWSIMTVAKLTGFGLTAGFFYFLANILAFDKLKTETASTLAMGETPAVIISAGIILGEELSLIQWAGVTIALGAILALSAVEAKASKKEVT